MQTSNQRSLLRRVKSKALGFWAMFSDDENERVHEKYEELQASGDGREHTMDEARDMVEHQGLDREYDHPNKRPNFEAPGTYPPSHRHMTEDKGPQGT